MLAGLSLVEIALFALGACLLDRVLGEPRRRHPLAGFGRVAQALEKRMNRAPRRLCGIAAVLLLIVPPTLLVALFVALADAAPAQAAVSVPLLYFALGAQSLREHVLPVAGALAAGDLAEARSLAGRIVSRDLSDADAGTVSRAAVESALENGNDAVFGALFWFAVAGAPGALAYRLANTLDAMWGYRDARFLEFGWCAARLDDALNFLPARLTALTYAAFGSSATALRCWRTQARLWASPNAGPVMASGAGALGVRLGGPAVYRGVVEDRPGLGCGAAPGSADVRRALALVEKSLLAWLAALALLGLPGLAWEWLRA